MYNIHILIAIYNIYNINYIIIPILQNFKVTTGFIKSAIDHSNQTTRLPHSPGPNSRQS